MPQDPSNYRSAIWCRLVNLMKIYWRLDIAGSSGLLFSDRLSHRFPCLRLSHCDDTRSLQIPVCRSWQTRQLPGCIQRNELRDLPGLRNYWYLASTDSQGRKSEME